MRTQDFNTKANETVTMRVAGRADRDAVERLAALDSQRAPEGDVMVAEVGGEIRAAIPVGGGRPIADPFHLTGNVVSLLRERVEQVVDPGAPHRVARGLRLARAA